MQLQILLSFLFVFSSLCPVYADPDPVELLRSVESKRASMRSGVLDMRIKRSLLRLPKYGSDDFQLRVSFDDPKVRYDQTQKVLMVDASSEEESERLEALLVVSGQDRQMMVDNKYGHWEIVNISSIFDGEQLLQYSANLGAKIVDPDEEGLGDWLFDPRILGLTGLLLHTYDITASLGYENAKNVIFVGTEVIDDVPAWVVFVDARKGGGRHYWIKQDGTFDVIKAVFEYSTSESWAVRTEIESRYNNTSVLPSHVTINNYSINLANQERTHTDNMDIEINELSQNTSMDGNLWTLRGLELPVGQPIKDYRVNLITGYWDGDTVSDTLKDATRVDKERRLAPLAWWNITILCVVSAVFIAKIFIARRVSSK